MVPKVCLSPWRRAKRIDQGCGVAFGVILNPLKRRDVLSMTMVKLVPDPLDVFHQVRELFVGDVDPPLDHRVVVRQPFVTKARQTAEYQGLGDTEPDGG